MRTNEETVKPLRILLIEDNTGDARLIQEEFKDVQELSYSLEHVTHLQAGLDYMSRHDVDVVLSDLSLPDSPGMETFKRLQAQASKIPVVVLTGFDNESMALNAVREGAQDYLIKGQVDGRALSRTILYAIERHRSQSSLRSLSLTDELTQLYNRRGFTTLGEQALKSASRVNSPLALFFVDLDGLKVINDRYGHPEGDRAIVGASEVLRKTFRQADVVARMGGDEFAVLAGLDQTGSPEVLISRLRGNLAQYNLAHPNAQRVELSVGVAMFDPAAPCLIGDLLQKADQSLYQDKKKRKAPAAAGTGDRWRLAGLLLLLGVDAWLWHSHAPKRASLSAAVPAAAAVSPGEPVAPQTMGRPAPVRAAPARPQAARSFAAPAKPLEIHRELIPSSVDIVKLTYEKALHHPGETFKFTLIGSGFTEAFRQTLTVFPGSAHVRVHDLRLVTVNHIEGLFDIGEGASTQYVYPYVLLSETPVFRANLPFAIIRPNEVLDIVFTKMDADAKTGNFRVYTNLSADQADRFAVSTGVPGLDVSHLTFKLPYVVEGSIHVSPEVPRGTYDVTASLNGHQAFVKENLVNVVRPTIGKTGVIERLRVDSAHVLPGDLLHVIIDGRGFSDGDEQGLKISIQGAPDASVHLVSESRMEASVVVPRDSEDGAYAVELLAHNETIFSASNAFTVVRSNWLGHLKVVSVSEDGSKLTLELSGRDLDRRFAHDVRITAEDQGLHASPLTWVNSQTLRSGLTVDPSVRPGMYLLHVSAGGKPIGLQEQPMIAVKSGS